MNPPFPEILQLGQTQGHITYEQLNAMLPEGLTSDQLDQLLLAAEEQGIEVIEGDPANPTQPAPPTPVPRFHRVLAFAERIRGLGVQFTDCVCYVDSGGQVASAKIMVAGKDALATWHKLRAHWPSFGYWPSISVYRWGHATRPDFVEVELPKANYYVDWVDASAKEKAKQELIEKANRCMPDPRTFHRWHTGALESLTDEEIDELCEGPARYEIAPRAHFRPSSFDLINNARTEEPYPWVSIALDPLTTPWEWFAVHPFGGWNGAPYPAEQLAMHRYWHELYGAELVIHDLDSYEMLIPRPPQTRRRALQLIREITGFGEETLFSGARDVEEMIERAMESHCWVFWWD